MNTANTKVQINSNLVVNYTNKEGMHAERGSVDPITALTERRLRDWLSVEFESRAQCPGKYQDQGDIDTLLSAPPIRRATMPTANLEPPRLSRLLRSMMDRAVYVRALRLRHRHSAGS